MGPVWILTKGDYSDYTILAVFSDEAVAHETGRRLGVGDAEPDSADITRYGEYQVERYQLDEVAWVARYKAHATIEDGQVRYPARVQPLTEQEGHGDFSRTGAEVSWRTTKDYSHPITYAESRAGREYPEVPAVHVTVYADEAERALKVATERVAQLIAEWEIEVEAARSRGELG